MTPVRVAVAQAESAPSLEEGLQRTRALASEAAAAGAELVLFPETWLPGYPAWLDVCRDVALWDHEPVKSVFAQYARQCVVVHGESGEMLRRIAVTSRITLIVGICERVTEGPGRGTLYNSMLVIGPDGEVLNHHRKLMPTYTERLVWGQGDSDGVRAVETPAGRVGGLICWEHWMPLARQALHDSGEDIHAALWPTVYERHQIASRHYAFEGRCFVLAAGSLMRASALPGALEPDPRRVSSPEQLVLRGGSAVIAPDGTYIVEPVFDEVRLIVADLELSRVREESMTLDVSGHYSRGDCFQFSTRPTGRLAGGS